MNVAVSHGETYESLAPPRKTETQQNQEAKSSDTTDTFGTGLLGEGDDGGWLLC